MEEFLQQLTNGLAVGGIYALIALGYTMVYGVLKLINFAHGDLFTIGAYLGFTVFAALGLSGHVSGAVAVLLVTTMVMGLVALIGYLLERVAYRPLRSSSRLSAVVSALGASIFFQNAVMLIYGAKFQVYPNDIRPTMAVSFFGMDIPLVRIMMFGASVALMLLLHFFIHRTIGNIPGAMVGGLLLGVIEALGAAYISIAWKDAIAFLVLILILIIRPTGLLGERVADKI